ncbi:MAG TPA: TonB family protein [Thermoanaerobaculia bacterium]|nr:TonB family protein [Thermoanaerobaculia bacterium]
MPRSLTALVLSLLVVLCASAAPAQTPPPEAEDVTAALVTLVHALRLGAELEYHQAQHGRYPAATTADELAVELASYSFLLENLLTDGWGRPMRLSVAPDGSFYRLESAGADGVFEDTAMAGSGQQVTDLDRDLVASSAGMLRSWEEAAVAAAERADLAAVEVWEERLDATRMRRATADVRNLGTALMSYAVDHERFPAATTTGELAEHLVPDYLSQVPTEDPWGTPYRVELSSDRRELQLISAGADGRFQPETWDVEAEVADPASDLVWSDGYFVRSWRLDTDGRGAMAEALEALVETREWAGKPLRRDPARLEQMRSERTEARLREVGDELADLVVASGSCPGGGHEAMHAALAAQKLAPYREALPIPEGAPADYRDLVESMRRSAEAGIARMRLVDEWGEPLRVECAPEGPIRVASVARPDLQAQISRAELAERRAEEERGRLAAEPKPPEPQPLPVKRFDSPQAPEGLEGPVRRQGFAPAYPAEARERGVVGTVVLSAVVTTRGTVTAIQVVESLDPLLDQAAIEAVREWQFEPATLHGAPVPVKLNLSFNFKPE